jgi:hypothetical protein
VLLTFLVHPRQRPSIGKRQQWKWRRWRRCCWNNCFNFNDDINSSRPIFFECGPRNSGGSSSNFVQCGGDGQHCLPRAGQPVQVHLQWFVHTINWVQIYRIRYTKKGILFLWANLLYNRKGSHSRRTRQSWRWKKGIKINNAEMPFFFGLHKPALGSRSPPCGGGNSAQSSYCSFFGSIRSVTVSRLVMVPEHYLETRQLPVDYTVI